MARQDFLDAENVVRLLNDAFNTHKKVVAESAEQVRKYQESVARLPSDFVKAQKELLDLSYKQARSEKELANSRNAKNRADQQAIQLQIKQNQLQKTDIQLTQAQAREKERLAKAEAKAANELNRANNLYNKVQTKVTQLTQTYNNLAIRKSLGLNLNTKEEAQLLSLEKRLLRYNDALKKVDAGIGKYTRFVGNYATGNAQLSSAIGQFSRELPNAGISISTFAISLSNQFGQLQDAIKATVAQNKELIAQGKPVQSVFKQILASVFSLSTAMYVGIALITAYSGEIEDWAKSLFGVNEAMEKLQENQTKLNQSQRSGLKSTVEARTALKENIAIAKDATLTDTERQIAIKKLRSEYPLYFKSLTDQQILAGETAEAEREITEALNKRGQANEAANVIAENDKRLIDLREELKTERELLQENEDRYKLRKQQAQGDAQFSGALANAQNAYESSQKRVKTIQEEIAVINRQNISQQDLILKLRKESIGLDYQEVESKKLQIEALKDVQASAYALNQQRLENERDFVKAIVDDERNGYADREAAAVRYGEILYELAQNRREEELRLLKQSTKDEISELKRRALEGEIAWSNANAVIKSIEQQSAYDRALIWENYSKEVVEANGEISKSLDGVWKDLDEQERKLKQLELHNNNLRQAGLFLDNVDGKTTAKQFAEIENQMREIQKMDEDSRIDELRAQREVLGGEIEKLKAEEKSLENNEALNDLLIKQREIDGQILDIELKRKEAVAGVYESMRNATNEYLQGITSGALADAGFSSLTSLFEQTSYEIVNELGEIETKTGSMFDKLFDQAGTMQEKFAVAFNAVTSIAQEAFSFITQASNASFQMQYDDLEKRQEIALKYAGESQAAQEEVNRQYEERRKEIKRRELKAQKEQAIFNAIINTAQGVTAALAQANIPLSIIIGALGAAQIAFIAGQQIPAYAEGTDNHSGGLMLVNDAKGSNYREVIQTPDGSVYKPQGRNVLMNAPKGTKVHKSIADFESQLNGILMNNDIAPFADVLMRDRFSSVVINQGGGGITKEEMATLMAKYQNKDTFHLNLDKRGINTYWKGRDAINRETANSIKIKR